MAVLRSSIACCVVIRCSSSEPNSTPPSTSSDPRQTKVILPKKKPQKWSTGVAPGEYGGPPTTTKLRKYWGGKSDEDPVTATDDFIWNKDFHDRMKRLISDDDDADTATVGFIPPSQVMSILSLNFLILL